MTLLMSVYKSVAAGDIAWKHSTFLCCPITQSPDGNFFFSHSEKMKHRFFFFLLHNCVCCVNRVNNSAKQMTGFVSGSAKSANLHNQCAAPGNLFSYPHTYS